MSLAGRRCMEAQKKFQTGPQWKDYILFYEYFHGDNGAGLAGEPPDRLDRPGCQTD